MKTSSKMKWLIAVAALTTVPSGIAAAQQPTAAQQNTANAALASGTNATPTAIAGAAQTAVSGIQSALLKAEQQLATARSSGSAVSALALNDLVSQLSATLAAAQSDLAKINAAVAVLNNPNSTADAKNAAQSQLTHSAGLLTVRSQRAAQLSQEGNVQATGVADSSLAGAEGAAVVAMSVSNDLPSQGVPDLFAVAGILAGNIPSVTGAGGVSFLPPPGAAVVPPGVPAPPPAPCSPQQ